MERKKSKDWLQLLQELEQWEQIIDKISRYKNGVTDLDLFRLLSNTKEQYRREQFREIYPSINPDLIDRLGVWEDHLHLKWTLEERLLAVLEYYNDIETDSK